MTGPRPLIVVSSDSDLAIAEIAERCATHRVASLYELPAILEGQLRRGEVPRSGCLDLVGHSTRGHHYLRLGATPIDLLDVFVRRCVRGLATAGILAALGISTIRLLGCETAVEPTGQRAMRLLAHELGVRVYGTRKPLGIWHYLPEGLDPRFERQLLIEVSDLPRPYRRLEPASSAATPAARSTSGRRAC